MKSSNKQNRLLLMFFFCGFSLSSFSQTAKDFFTSSETAVVFLGVDFTKAKVINEPGANAIDIRNGYNSVNNVIMSESKKYNLAEVFHKSYIASDLTAVKAKNEKINAEEILSSNTEDYHRLEESDINAVIKTLNISGKKGIGLIFVIEGFRKEGKARNASVWTVLINLQSKKVLMAERSDAKVGGVGFRNSWASAIKSTLQNIEKSKYKEWKEKYGS